ncbi:hypothetical protein M1116_04180 [Patescibacteria group bacterium]|nr:hypothetical protein [Patescibacteria group bacterium]
MRVAIIGSDHHSLELATNFIRLGYDVMIGTCHPRQKIVKLWQQAHGRSAHVGTILKALRFGYFVIIVELPNCTHCLRQLSGNTTINRKPVIDLLNILDSSPVRP